MIIDIDSCLITRSVATRSVAPTEAGDLASELIDTAIAIQGVSGNQLA